MLRYSIVWHQTVVPHVDIFLARPGGSLATWSVPKWTGNVARQQAALKPDHRRVYLNYQGPISKGRGYVQLIDQGCFDLLAGNLGPAHSLSRHVELEPEMIRVQLRGGRWPGVLEFRPWSTGRDGQDKWWCYFSPFVGKTGLGTFSSSPSTG